MVILLDIDGVMAPATLWRKPEFLDDGFPVFSVKAVQALNKILSQTNSDLLLTTSHKTKYTIKQWLNIFSSRGVHLNKIHRLTTSGSTRKEEILNWYISKHHINEPFVIIDDDKSLNDLPLYIKENLVLTSGSLGLTDELADDAIAILKYKALSIA